VNFPLQLVRGGNNKTKETENFLLELPDVLDASVWIDANGMVAHVTLAEGAKWTERSLRLHCAMTIGLPATPREVILKAARRKVA
jgi:AMP-binding enzyme